MQANYEKFIKHVKAKLLIMSLSTLLPIIIVSVLTPLQEITKFEPTVDMIAIRYIAFGLFELAILYKIYVYIKILKDSEFANEKYIKKYDERLNFVKSQTGALALKILWYSLAVLIVLAGFIDLKIFYTLIAVLALTLTIFGICMIYYNKKY